MTIRTDLIRLAHGVWVEPDALAHAGYEPAGRPSEGSADRLVLPEDHPMWDHASGGNRNRPDKQWSADDLVQAALTLQGIAGKKAGAFFDLLLAAPGRLFTAEEIVQQCNTAFRSPHAIAGSLNGFRKHVERANKVYPFYWWEAESASMTRYAVRPSVAAIFSSAQRSGHLG